MTNAEREEDVLLKMKDGRSYEELGDDSDKAGVLTMSYPYATVISGAMAVNAACGNGDPSSIMLWGEEE